MVVLTICNCAYLCAYNVFMADDRKKVSLYISEGLWERTKAVLKDQGSSASEFIENVLTEMLPILEAVDTGGKSVTANDIDSVASMLGVQMMTHGARLGDLMRTLEGQLKEMEESKK